MGRWFGTGINGALSLCIALVNLALVVWLRRSRREYKSLFYVMLGIMFTFVVMAIPLQLRGDHFILFWASEMVLLGWLYIHSRIRLYEHLSFLLIPLTLLSFLWGGWDAGLAVAGGEVLFLNATFAVNLFTGLAFGVYGYLMSRYPLPFEQARVMKPVPFNALLWIFSAVAVYCSFMLDFARHVDPSPRGAVMQCFTAGYLLLLCVLARRRFPVHRFVAVYGLLLLVPVCWFARMIGEEAFPLLVGSIVLLVALLFLYIIRQYNRLRGDRPWSNGFMIYLNIAATLFWVEVVEYLVNRLGLPGEARAGFSVALVVAGFVQMALGMHFSLKIARVVSLVTFGIVFLKLLLSDMWAMPAVGKIIVFILLGIILLVLSFLYQKLKVILFKEDEAPAVHSGEE
jgi:uncharacterized membrane protein